jgi:hypothetical protein
MKSDPQVPLTNPEGSDAGINLRAIDRQRATTQIREKWGLQYLYP